MVCPICSQKGGFVPHWQGFNRCKTCGAISRYPFPTETELRHLYHSSWADRDAHVDETGGTDLGLGRLIVAALLHELRLSSFAGHRILDVGAGRGGMSLALREAAGQVVAVEPFGYEQLRHLDIPVYRDIDELAPNPQFDGIVMIEVIEHLRDPRELLRRLYLRLKPGGWLFLTTPNPQGLAALLRGRRWGSASNAGHILFFTSRTLHRVLVEQGFSDIRRTHWIIRFPDVSVAHAMVQIGLQALHVGGGLRFLAVKPAPVREILDG